MQLEKETDGKEQTKNADNTNSSGWWKTRVYQVHQRSTVEPTPLVPSRFMPCR